jgi:hypothetical protein
MLIITQTDRNSMRAVVAADCGGPFDVIGSMTWKRG